MAVSQKGYDVKTCDARFLAFSSSFQTLKIFNTFTATTTIPSSGTNTITITHNIGYYAPYLIVYNGSTGSGSRGTGSSFLNNDGSFEITARQYANSLQIDVPNGFDLFGSSNGNTVYFTVYIFLDDFRSVSPLTINTGSSSGVSSNDYGMRISKPGFDVKTCDDVDCSFSTSFFNQIVHMKGTIYGLNNVTHALGYIPNFLNFTLSSGSNYLQTFGISGQADSNIFYTNNLSTDTCYYIIFKDNIN